MQIVIDIPDEQVNMSLEESKYINEDEGEKGSVHIAMLYTNAQLEFVDVERKTDYCSCEYKILPKGHGRLKDIDWIDDNCPDYRTEDGVWCYKWEDIDNAPTIIAESEVEE